MALDKPTAQAVGYCHKASGKQEDSMDVRPGSRIRLIETAPVSAQFVGRVGTVVRVLPNAVILDIEGHGGAIVHRGWGTRRNPGDLRFEVVSA